MTTARKYGCHNRPPLRSELEVQTGWTRIHTLWRFITRGDRRVRTVGGSTYEKTTTWLPVRFSDECHYDQQQRDPQCAGCRHIRGDAK